MQMLGSPSDQRALEGEVPVLGSPSDQKALEGEVPDFEEPTDSGADQEDDIPF
jgi:hypothetical protein